MARLRRLSIPGVPQLVMIDGNNHQRCFRAKTDYEFYLECLSDVSEKYDVLIRAFCLLPNRILLVLCHADDLAISKMIQQVGRHYVPYFNHKYERSGTLWQGRYKSCLINVEDWLLKTVRYIERLPVLEGLSQHSSEYPWSSYAFHALGEDSYFLTAHTNYLLLGITKEQRVQAYLEYCESKPTHEEIQQIEEAVGSNRVLGPENFIRWVEQQLTVTVTKKRPGRKPGGYKQLNLSMPPV